MTLRIVEEPEQSIAAYATIPIAFEVRAVLDLTSLPVAGEPQRFVERELSSPWTKDYDAPPGESPHGWPARFERGEWAMFAAYGESRRVGGAVVVRSAPDLDLLDGRPDVALLWDIRVAPDMRRGGVGGALLTAAARWATVRGAVWLMVETQDVNVPACRFYSSNEFQLRHVHADAYPELPQETQLLWYRRLVGAAGGGG